MRSFIFMLLTTGLISCGKNAIRETLTDQQPNILVILTDDQSFKDLGCYGAEDLLTPNIDQIASTGIRFTQFYAAAPVCSPSRAAMITGKYNYNAGVFGNVPPPHIDSLGRGGLPAEQITMAEVFKEAGYRTALIGKWHLGHTREKLPNAQGFDYFFGHQRGCIDNYSHFFYWSGPNLHDLYENEKEVFMEGSFFGDLMVEKIKAFTSKPMDDPFFILWTINMPHYPYQGKSAWLEYYDKLKTPRKEYNAFITTMDELIGEVYAHLKTTGQLENTIIVFQTDHGHSVEERAYFGGGDAGPFSGAKFSMLEGGIRIPAIISMPGKIPQHEVRHQMAASIDWLPTLADIADIENKEKLLTDGKSLKEVIMSASSPSPHQILHWATGNPVDGSYYWAVRNGDWKLLGNPRDPTGKLRFTEDDAFYLVNLKMDSTESKNLSEEFPDKLKELKDLHYNWLEGVTTN
ncbi:MAG: sulfatase-like hydrolase/transferase [Cyclobacteriaceae bacterium]|nr:sulfatase-like hydrolase/transferase [Cyclobacteriaceae bacterium]